MRTRVTRAQRDWILDYAQRQELWPGCRVGVNIALRRGVLAQVVVDSIRWYFPDRNGVPATYAQPICDGIIVVPDGEED